MALSSSGARSPHGYMVLGQPNGTPGASIVARGSAEQANRGCSNSLLPVALSIVAALVIALVVVKMKMTAQGAAGASLPQVRVEPPAASPSTAPPVTESPRAEEVLETGRESPRTSAEPRTGGLGQQSGQAQGPESLAPAAQASSLFCFTLIQASGKGGDPSLLRSAAAYSDEPELLRAQESQLVGLFACDRWTIYSNASVPIGGAFTVPIAGSLECTFSRKNALNTEVFIRVWLAVAMDGAYSQYDWTVKADADTVFVPGRLRSLLGQISARHPGPVYLNNCWRGPTMHGPMEVLSREAVQTFLAGLDRCGELRRQAMAPNLGPDDWQHSFGEDTFVTRCLGLLGVRSVNEFRLLSEAACPPPSAPMVAVLPSCDARHIAFHPFKTLPLYFNCLHAADASGQGA